MTHSDILTITLNPALDLSTQVGRVRAGPKLRCDTPRRDPGGGGINVSRAIRHLGGESMAIVALGGATGAMVRVMMEAEGLRMHAIALPGETRQSMTVNDRSTGGQYRFVFPGPSWSAVETATLLGTCTTMAGRDTLVVLSGSLPPGVLPSLPQELCTSLAASGARLIVDTSGAGLLRLANQPGLHKPRLLRFDQQEAEELAGHTLASPADTAQLAENLVHRGVADAVMIARGAEGNIVADGSERLICIPAPVPVRSKVGAGDSFVAACTLSLSRGGSLSEALLYGTAAANAAVMTDATELCHAEDVSRLLPRCRVMSV